MWIRFCVCLQPVNVLFLFFIIVIIVILKVILYYFIVMILVCSIRQYFFTCVGSLMFYHFRYDVSYERGTTKKML